MVKYTGYGNAAGLLQRHGLFMGGNANTSNEFSEDEESDTETYVENEHKYVILVYFCLFLLIFCLFFAYFLFIFAYFSTGSIRLLDALKKK